MRPYYHLVLLLLVFFAVGVSAAQGVELSETYTFEDGASFQYPSDWTLDDAGPVSVASDQTRVTVVDNAALRRLGVSSGRAITDALHSYFLDQHSDISYKTALAESVEIGGRDALRYPYEASEDNAGLLIALRFGDGNIGILDAVSLDGELTEEETVLAIAASFEKHSEAVTDQTVKATPAPASEVNCTVSTTYANAVQLRVGPGNNRTTFAFLPVDTEFEVLGKAQASDDSIWWKLDRQEVAPKKSAAEAWVAELDVEETGNCDAVVDVNAPPLIPIVSAPPVSNPGSNNPSTGGAVPGAGTWTIVYPATVPGSCLSNPGLTVQVPLNWESEVVSISAPGGSSIRVGGSSFVSIQPGVYQGSLTLEDGSSELMTLRVISDAVMTVEFIFTASIEDTQCSLTITGTATRN